MKYYPKSNVEWLDELNHNLETTLSEFDIKVEDIAMSMAISKRQFYRRVQTLTGRTPNQYFNDLKFEKAYEYLTTKKYNTVMETASAVGFRDTVYFSRQFKKRYGKHPSELMS